MLLFISLSTVFIVRPSYPRDIKTFLGGVASMGEGETQSLEKFKGLDL